MNDRIDRWGATDRFIPVLALALAAACDDVDWPAAEKISTLRVLGVRAEPPTLAPGLSTELSVICADGRSGASQSTECEVETAWLAGCNNPDKNDPTKCLGRYAPWAAELASPVAETPREAYPPGFGFGSSFTFSAPLDILSERTEVSGNPVGFGTSYVFFAVCAGRLEPVPSVSERLPLACRDRTSGNLLDQRAFVVGVTTLYSYDRILSKNPALLAPRFDGHALPPSCASDAECPAGFECAESTNCVPVVDRCPDAESSACAWHKLSFGLERDSFSVFANDGARWETIDKALWLDSFTNAGSLPDEDTSFSLRPPVSATESERTRDVLWRAPAVPTEQAHLWAVVRDNRGGLTVWDQRIIVR